jgi:hypothetical protein
MSATSGKSGLGTLRVIPRRIFSRVLRAGARRSDWLAGLQIDLFGPEVVPASPSAKPETAEASKTSAICGPSSAVSSISAALQLSLESRLHRRMDVDGSPEYALTWKRWDMAHGPPICALRASARPKSASASSGEVGGYPTPSASGFEAVDAGRLLERRAECKERTGNGNGFGLTLGQFACLTGYPTPTARDWRSDRSRLSGPELYGTKGRPLARVAIDLAGYPTPTSLSFNESHQPGNSRSLNKIRDIGLHMTAGYSTPKTSDGNRDPGQATRYLPGGRQRSNLKDAAKYISGYPTPTVNDSRNGRNATAGRSADQVGKHHAGTTLSDLAFGEATMSSGSRDQTASGGALNTAFVSWLQGFRAEWESCADTVALSFRSLRRSSSRKRTAASQTAA